MKFNKYGYLVGALMLALGWQSCQVQEDAPGAEQYPILFGKTSARAVAGLDDLKNNGFKVYAYFAGNAGSATFEKNVTYKSNQSVWGYEGLEYWMPGVEYWFKAFYPQTSSAGALNVDNSNSSQSYTITNFDITKQEDIMEATANCKVAVGASHPESGSVVTLYFDHLLACVVIEMKSGMDGITINKITLSDVANYGQYENGMWSSSNTSSISITSGVSLTKGSDYVDVTHGGLLVIPESVNGQQDLTIEASNNKKYDITLPSGTWEKGNKYTYKAEIKENDIIFNEPSISKKWESESATGSVIIK